MAFCHAQRRGDGKAQTMFSSNFRFLETEFPLLFNVGQSAEYYLHTDPVVTLTKLRFMGEKLTEKLYDEHGMAFPRENSFYNRIQELEEEGVLPYRVKDLLDALRRKGNRASHTNRSTFNEAKAGLYEAFRIAKWFHETYARSLEDLSTLQFIAPPNLDARHALHTLEQEHKALKAEFEKLLEERKVEALPEEKQQAIKERAYTAAHKIDMSEEDTRELIDAALQKAGWEVSTQALNYKTQKTLPEKGRNMAIAEWPVGSRWADYALFIGTQLYGIVEAKRYAQDISTDLRQAKVYAELAEAKHEARLLGEWRGYKVPFLFATNGRPYLEQIRTKSGIWFWDARKERIRPRPLQGWYSPDGLKKLYEQDLATAEQKLRDNAPNFLRDTSGLNLRDYQIKAIEAVEQQILEKPEERRALLAMATGTGKTRTIIGLCYRLIQSNRFRRILFLVDRRLLGIQAMNAFKDNKIESLNTFAEVYQVEELKTTVPDIDTRLHFATVQGMVKRLYYQEDEENIPPIDTYDCIIIDEAHRGYLMDREIDEEDLLFKNQKDYVSKYRRVLEYFDAYAIGLTATPALHTKEIFGTPVFTYSYREAVIDGFLIDHEPPHLIKTKLSEEGILWEKGEKPKAYDKESNQIIELDELEDELQIEVEGFNRLVMTEPFNRTVIQALVKDIDPEAEEKTLIFAARDEHADMVVDLLREAYEEMGASVPEEAIQKITGKSYDPTELLKRFRNEKYPSIAVTVDLLSTGIDVPAICNLVFLRRVKSRILYEQMLGRATRRCDEIGKEIFHIYDAVRLYEALEDYTSMKPVVPNPSTSFRQLVEEMRQINSEERARKQVEQLIAKFQRKKGNIKDQQEATFTYLAKGRDPESFLQMLKDTPPQESLNTVMAYSELWKFLDELKPAPSVMLVSEHEDAYITTERGYGKGQKPEDYLESFERFIRENQNKIAALNLVCTRPQELDRQSLRELKIELDRQGFNAVSLQTAWKSAKNEDIAADIISYIRTLAIGSSLVSHEDRIKAAVDQVRNMKEWNKIQQKWIDRFEKQLIQETVLRLENLDEEPFRSEGGFQRLNKIFGEELEQIIDTININLYADSA